MPFDYTLLRSGRKTLAMEVTRDLRVLVRAPNHASRVQIERFVEQHRAWAEKQLAAMAQRAEACPEPAEEEIPALIARAKEVLPQRVAHFSVIMGLEPAGITVTGARTRFGSCSPKNRLCFSWRLMAYPTEAIDYVVVHELAHIRHKNHGKEFYALIASILPDYRAREALLRGK